MSSTPSSLRIPCSTCDGYQLVPDDLGELHDCPDCHATTTVCPVHGETVAISGGKLAGQCWGCAREAAEAIKELERRVAEPVVVVEELVCPCCGQFTRRVFETTGWCVTCSREAARSAA